MTHFKLQLLEQHDRTLQKCVYCPKLSRAACPVSNVEGNETVTPWGKMSMAWFAARGDVPIDEPHAAPAWACSGCYACRERCDHKNEVATVLTDARAELFASGVAPAGAQRLVARFPDKIAESTRAAQQLQQSAGAGSTPDTALLVGCGYLRWHPEVARSIVRVTEALVGQPPRLLGGCCGLPLSWAGDRQGFLATAAAFVRDLGSSSRLVVADPGCARALLVEYPRVGVELGSTPRPELLLDLAAASSKVGPLPDPMRVRWHDPCQLGRGLGRFDEPRALLRRLLGAPADEFLYQRELAACSGAGGVLPSTRPESSAQIADERIADHRARGGGTLVTACASSLRRFRDRGERAEDLFSLVERGLGIALSSQRSAISSQGGENR